MIISSSSSRVINVVLIEVVLIVLVIVVVIVVVEVMIEMINRLVIVGLGYQIWISSIKQKRV